MISATGQSFGGRNRLCCKVVFVWFVGVFDPIDPVVEGLAVLDEGASLADRLRRYVDGGELTHHGEPSQFEGVVLVGFAFEVAPFPKRVYENCSTGWELPSESKNVSKHCSTQGL